MRFFHVWIAAFCLVVSGASAAATAKSDTAGIEALVRRRLPQHANSFNFTLHETSSPRSYGSSNRPSLDQYSVSNGSNGTIQISGNSQIALASGLRWYLSNYAHVDIYWFIGSRLHLAPPRLPTVNQTYHGQSIVPWRYHFNTVTFSYTSAFWGWEEWETQLDWMALHGINLPLAWVGYEKILMEVLLDVGFTGEEVASFLSGPAFQAWNRFGNIQGSWDDGGKDLPLNWLDGQFALQKKIVARMVELGMTPVLPSFTGFVPRAISRVYPHADFVNGSQWNDFPTSLTNVTFLEPTDSLFTELQKRFIQKQADAYGNVTHVYTLDQFNENNPASGDLDYLGKTAKGIISSLKAADEDAVWLLQGWLFFSSETFWTDDRVKAYLGGVNDTDMLILDLFSESQPQWQRTNNYFGKPWIWCELHDYGGNVGIYGQVENVTINPIAALNNKSSTMVGMGLTPEGQEGNEIMYDLLLDQAWQKSPISTGSYFRDWVKARYHETSSLPAGLYNAWDILRRTAYNNTQLQKAQAVTKSILVLAPNTTGLVNRTGHHPTTIVYEPVDLQKAWKDFYAASHQDPTLWDNPAYTFDLTDLTRQVLANAFQPLYTNFTLAANKSHAATYSKPPASNTAERMLAILRDLNTVLSASPHPDFHLSNWIASARRWSSLTTAGTSSSARTNSTPPATESPSFYEYSARNQITLWGPSGEISDYASKQWGGLVSSYYLPRWERFVNFTLNGTTSNHGVNEELKNSLVEFEMRWQTETWGDRMGESYVVPSGSNFARTISEVVGRWTELFEQE